MFSSGFARNSPSNARSSVSNARRRWSTSPHMMHREEEARCGAAASPSSLFRGGCAHRVGVWLIYGLLSVCNNRRLYPPRIHPAINNRPLRSLLAKVGLSRETENGADVEFLAAFASKHRLVQIIHDDEYFFGCKNCDFCIARSSKSEELFNFFKKILFLFFF